MQNDMRDRLVNLLNFVQCKAECCAALDGGRCGDLDNLDRCQIETIADHLIANGVIVPPCKVGDKVYKISRNKVKECEVVFVGISADEKCSYFNFVENYADGTFYKSYSMVFSVIGKTVFLTKEEAEQKLKEMRVENGNL